MTQIIAIPTAACHATIPGAIVACDALRSCNRLRRRLELGAGELAAPPLPTLLPTRPTHNQPDHRTLDQARAPILPPITTPPDANGPSAPQDAHSRFTTSPRPALRGQKAERETAQFERATLAPWRAGIEPARMIRRLLTVQAQNAGRVQRAKDPNPSLPPATRPADGTLRSDTPAAGHPPIDDRSRSGPPARRMQIEPTERNAIQRETMPDPARPAKDSDKIPMQRGTVSHPTRPAETAGEISDRTPCNVVRCRARLPSGPAGEDSDRTPLHRDTAAHAVRPATAQVSGSDKTPMHRGTVPSAPNPFRQALLASTVSSDPEAHQLAALSERIGGWPAMTAAAGEQRAGRDWRPAAAAARQGLLADAARPTARHPALLADLVRNAIAPPTDPATLAISRPLRDSTPLGQVKSVRAP